MEPADHFMLKLIHMNWTTLDEFCKLHLSLSAGAERAGSLAVGLSPLSGKTRIRSDCAPA